MKCHDCGKRISSKRRVQINVLNGHTVMTTFFVCEECAAILQLFVNLSEEVGEKKFEALLKALLEERKNDNK